MIGSGNMATFLALRLKEAGHPILQIISPQIQHAQTLADQVQAAATTDISQIRSDAEVVILAVPDDTLRQLADSLKLPHQTVIHTAGSVPASVLSGVSQKHACIWSIYSIQKEKIPTHRNIPMVVSSQDAKTLELAQNLAKDISDVVYMLDDTQKSWAHLGAVIVNNFSNHLMVVCEQLMQDHHIPFELFRPIIQDTVEKLSQRSPKTLQSGPAIRGDEQTIKAQMDMLAAYPMFARLYEMLSRSIQEIHHTHPTPSS